MSCLASSMSSLSGNLSLMLSANSYTMSSLDFPPLDPDTQGCINSMVFTKDIVSCRCHEDKFKDANSLNKLAGGKVCLGKNAAVRLSSAPRRFQQDRFHTELYIFALCKCTYYI